MLVCVGGDEFVLFIIDFGQFYESGVQVLVEKCIKVVFEMLYLVQGEYQLGVLVGIVVCDGSCDVDSLLQVVDKVMYVVKGNGCGCYVIVLVWLGVLGEFSVLGGIVGMICLVGFVYS